MSFYVPEGLREFLDSIQHTEAPPPKPCVYVLHVRGEPVYVGQTNNLASRLTAHVESKGFDGAFYIPCSSSKDRDALERYLIQKLDPSLNRTKPPICEEGSHRVSLLKRRTNAPRQVKFQDILRRAEHDFNLKHDPKSIFSLTELIGHSDASEPN